MTSSMIWHNIDTVYGSYRQYIYISLVYRPSLTIEVYHRNQPNTSKLALYEPLHSPFITVYINNKKMYYKIECGMCVLRYFKEEQTWVWIMVLVY